MNSCQHLPSPDSVLNAALRQAMSGTQNQDGADLGQAAALINQGNNDLQAAVDILARDLPSDAPQPAVLTV